MLLIQDRLVSLSLLEEHFVCDLGKCKGACCVQGDFGAPLEDEEIAYLGANIESILPYITPEGRETISSTGIHVHYPEPDITGTPLRADGACAFVTFDDNGTARCGIENAFREGAVDLVKPVSCHLYPVRVTSNADLDFEALNYNKWSICSPACRKGAELKVPLYKFVRNGLVRKFGVDFYDELDEVATELKRTTGTPYDRG